MRFAWDTYASRQQFDYLLVLNDDIRLYDGALRGLLNAANELEQEGCVAYAVCGALRLPHSGDVAYGAVVRSSSWHPLRFAKLPPSEGIQECDTMNMNFALISRTALSRIGFLERDFAHAKADYDFGLRLRAAGGRVILAPGYLGECNTNPLSRSSAADNLSFPERWRRLTGLKEQPPRERAIYYRRHGGVFWPLLWAAPYIRVFVEWLLGTRNGPRGEQGPDHK
jgi:GT2 family glycosyltransferase